MTQDVSAPRGERNGRNDSIGLLAAGCLLVWFLIRYRFHYWGFPSEPVIVTLAFALGGYVARGVTLPGAFAGWVIALTLYAFGNRPLFAVLFVVFSLTWIATRARRTRKEEFGLAESRSGRNANQVVANLGLAALFATFEYDTHASHIWERNFVPVLAALSAAAADTVSSEIGVGFAKSARLITNLKQVAVGTNGGISLVGTTAGVLAASFTAMPGVFVEGMSAKTVLLAAGCGIFGMFVDSLLGATLERRGYLNNDAVNFLGTASAAGLALLLTTTY